MKWMVFAVAVVATGSMAAQVGCREDRDTQQKVCFDPKGVTSNGDLRAFTLYTGGPKGITKTSQTAVFNCEAGYLELRDRQGVVFARDQPSKTHIVWLREDVCSLKQTKNDPGLK